MKHGTINTIPELASYALCVMNQLEDAKTTLYGITMNLFAKDAAPCCEEMVIEKPFVDLPANPHQVIKALETIAERADDGGVSWMVSFGT